MTPEKNALAIDQRKTQILIWIAGSLEFFVTCLPSHIPADIDAAIEYAVDLYLNRRETPGSAIPMGVALARRRIKQRQAAAAASVIAGDFIAKRRQLAGI